MGRTWTELSEVWTITSEVRRNGNVFCPFVIFIKIYNVYKSNHNNSTLILQIMFQNYAGHDIGSIDYKMARKSVAISI